MIKQEQINKEVVRRLGIIGGLGPEISSKFCLNINNKFREFTNFQPDITLENLPVKAEIERKIINGETPIEMLNLLSKAVKRLSDAQVDFIVIPCNTVHVFIDELRKISKVPILSIIEETAKECKSRNLGKVGLIASKTTIKEKLHLNELIKNRIKVFLPNKKYQEEINKIIFKIIHNGATSEDRQLLLDIIKKLKSRGAEAVILGCTDLSLLISEKNSVLPLIDTCSVLEDCSVSRLIK